MLKTGSGDFKVLLATSLLFVALLFPNLDSARGKNEEDKTARGAGLFAQSCQQCHPGGANIVNPKKPIKGSETLKTLATFKQYLNHPIGDMPFEAHIVDDEGNLKAIYDYCKSL